MFQRLALADEIAQAAHAKDVRAFRSGLIALEFVALFQGLPQFS